LQTEDEKEFEKIPTGQARPNVLFEAGMAMGRNPKRTVLVQVGDLRPFSDVGGRHVLHLNNSSERRQDLADRLKTAGCLVDLSGRDWHKVGSFTLKAVESGFPAKGVPNHSATEAIPFQAHGNAVLPAIASDLSEQ